MQKSKSQLKFKKRKGFSTFEIMIALALIVISITLVLPLLSGSQSTTVGSQTNQEALYKAKDLLESARQMSILNFSSIVTTAPVYDDIYTKNITVTDIDSSTKKIQSNVSWTSEGKNLAVNLTTLLTHIDVGGDTCNPVLTGDWTNPQLLGTADFGGPEGATDIDVISKKVYATADATAANKGDFYIIDVSDPNPSGDLPILNNPPNGLHTGPGLAAIHVAGKYAYVAKISTLTSDTQLQVIDISISTAPVVVSSLDITTVVGDVADGNSIFYDNKKIYLGLTKSDGPEFYVIDVSDPTNLSPTSIKASFETNTQINAIIVKNNIAYLTVRYALDGVTPEQLKILDVSQADSGIITPINTFSPNPVTMSGQSLYLSKNGNTLYLGEGGANPSNDPQFFLLDVTNPSSINQTNSKYIDTSNDVTVEAITVRSNLAFMVTNDTNLGFQIWDLNNLGSISPYGSINIEQGSTGGMDCEGNLVFVAQRSNDALQIIGPGD